MADDTRNDGEIEVVRNDAAERYEILVGGTVAGFSVFAPDEHGRLVFPHTEIDPASGCSSPATIRRVVV